MRIKIFFSFGALLYQVVTKRKLALVTFFIYRSSSRVSFKRDFFIICQHLRDLSLLMVNSSIKGQVQKAMIYGCFVLLRPFRENIVS
jgi:hypothetical protein